MGAVICPHYFYARTLLYIKSPTPTPIPEWEGVQSVECRVQSVECRVMISPIIANLICNPLMRMGSFLREIPGQARNEGKALGRHSIGGGM